MKKNTLLLLNPNAAWFSKPIKQLFHPLHSPKKYPEQTILGAQKVEADSSILNPTNYACIS